MSTTTGVKMLKRDYNAVGDGTTDDTEKVKSFFDYLANNGGTGIIEPGIYLCGSYTKDGNAKAFDIIGAGRNVSILKNKSANNFLTWKNCNEIRIKGLELDCQYTTIKPTGSNRKHGFVFVSCQNCSIEDSSVYDFVGTGFMAYKDMESARQSINITFKNCVAQASQAFTDWKAATVKVEKDKKQCNGVILADCRDSMISECTAIDISLFGIELKNNSQWNKVLHNKAVGCVYGFGMGQQTTGDIGCEHNIVEGFQARKCYMGGFLGKAKRNIISDFEVDFSDMNAADIRNAFRFQLNSRFNSLNNILISGMPAGKVAILYESGADNNISTVSFCEKNQTNGNVIIAQYNNSSATVIDTENNFTLLYRSDAPRNKLKVSGSAVSNNKSRYLWDNSDILA